MGRFGWVDLGDVLAGALLPPGGEQAAVTVAGVALEAAEREGQAGLGVDRREARRDPVDAAGVEAGDVAPAELVTVEVEQVPDRHERGHRGEALRLGPVAGRPE